MANADGRYIPADMPSTKSRIVRWEKSVVCGIIKRTIAETLKDIRIDLL